MPQSVEGFEHSPITSTEVVSSTTFHLTKCQINRVPVSFKGWPHHFGEGIVVWTERTSHRRHRQRTLGRLIPVQFALFGQDPETA